VGSCRHLRQCDCQDPKLYAMRRKRVDSGINAALLKRKSPSHRSRKAPHVFRRESIQDRPPRDAVRALRTIRVRRPRHPRPRTSGRPNDRFGLGVDEVEAVLERDYRFVREVLGPLNSTADREGCRLENGQVVTPKRLQRRVEQALRERLQDGERAGRVRRAGRSGVALRAGRRDALGQQRGVQMYPALAYGSGGS